MPDIKAQVTVRMEPDLLEKIDRLAHKKGLSTNQCITAILRSFNYAKPSFSAE